jgi:peroxiredoxin
MAGVTRDEKGGRKFKEKHSLTYPIWVDGDMFEKMIGGYIPWNVIIDREGKVRYSKVGAPSEEAKKLLDELLKSK